MIVIVFPVVVVVLVGLVGGGLFGVVGGVVVVSVVWVAVVVSADVVEEAEVICVEDSVVPPPVLPPDPGLDGATPIMPGFVPVLLVGLTPPPVFTVDLVVPVLDPVLEFPFRELVLLVPLAS